MIKIRTLLNERKKYEVGNKKENRFQTDYILDKLNQDETYLILPSFIFQKSGGEIRDIKDLMFEEYHLACIIGLGNIWHPLSNISFVLVGLKRKISEVIYMIDHPSCQTFSVKNKDNKQKILENQIITDDYENYLTSVESFIQNPTKHNLDVFEVARQDINEQRLYLEFYLPKYKELDERLSKEKTKPLSALADIILPKTSKDNRLTLKTKDFKYPIEKSNLTKSRAGNIPLQKGDLLLMKLGKTSSYLVNDKIDNIYPSIFSFIIRVKSKEISPEYLFLFFQSEVAKKYILRNSTSQVITHISIDDLNNTPIIIPNKNTLKRTNEVFEAIYLKTQEKSKIEQINDLLFDKNRSIKPIQKEFVDELLQKIKTTKLKLIKEIVEADFKEIQKCVGQDAYKATVILCGSILEAILLDWLSEINNKNYFNSKEKVSFFDMIKEMERSGVFNRTDTDYANKIREYRNLVHPKKMLMRNVILDRTIVKDMIWKLKKLLEKRELT
jgi:hypothetical protein